MKDGIVAKLASQCEEFYSEALKLMQASRNIWDREWLPKVSARQDSYQGIAQFFQSRVCSSKKLVGEEIARLQVQFTFLIYWKQQFVVAISCCGISNGN